MALPTVWNLIIPNFNAATIIGVVLILIAIFGGPLFKLIGAFVERISQGRINRNFLVFTFLFVGVVLIWGVSIVQDIFQSQEALLIMAGIVFLIAIIIYSIRTGDQ